ncbi:MAG: PadR family transcriptional regulator [Coriobacteriales bacterium]|jgi:DNA-binding PadR family transcriptional regulator|nr:PadR family transcriptional regulator [Coriobacteriales bacterium]
MKVRGIQMSVAECMVLGLLSQGYRYGHELDKVVEERRMRLWSKLTRETLYQALKRIEGKGWAVAATEKEGERPSRTTYTLTEKGQQSLRDMVADGLASQEVTNFDICVYVGFLYLLEPQDAIAQLRNRRASREAIVASIPETWTAENLPFGKRMNSKLIKSYYQMEIDWIDDIISDLKNHVAESIRDTEARQ